MLREDNTWQLYAEVDTPVDCHIILPDDTAWRLLTKGVDRAAARQRSTIAGDATLAAPFFEMVSIIA